MTNTRFFSNGTDKGDISLTLAELDVAARINTAIGGGPVRLDRPEIDVRALRERLGLTQDQFALRYALDIDTLRNWETRRRHPDAAALAYLGVIARLPEQVSRVLERPLASAQAQTAETARLRKTAVGVMEALHPDRAQENRRMVGRVPDEALVDLLEAADGLMMARMAPFSKAER